MKRLLIIPATLALLTGLSATAQESNENADAVKTPAAISSETSEQSAGDGMTIEQLNAMQLQQLKGATAQTAGNSGSAFQTATAPDSSDPAATGINAEATVSTEMGGPDPMSKADAMTHAGMSGTLAQVAMDDARFTTLVSLVKLAGLDEALSGDGPYTLFAPTNAAFDKLDPDVVAHLTSDEGKAELAALLKGHIVDGKYPAADIGQGETELATLAGTRMDIERSGDTVTADAVAVIATDIKASNGVIHAIDTVIMEPPGEAAPAGEDMDMSGQ